MSTPNFLDKLTGKKDPTPKTFLALVLSDHRVQAAVWQVGVTGTEIVSLGTPVEWDGDVATTNELVSAVDGTISSATEGLELDPDEIVLGLANSWVESSGIKQSKKDLIKSICRELSLKPIGYVVLSDTIVKYLKMQEGAPPTSFLIQVDRRSVILSLVELGTIKYTVSVPAGSNVSQDVATAITKLPQDIALPSRFILVSAMENTSDLVQSLTAYDWQKSFSFLHTPKIEALPKDVEVHATAVAGGSEVASSLGFSIEAPVVKESSPPPQSDKAAAEAPSLSASDLGFQPTKAQDLVTPSLKPPTPEETEDLPKEEAPGVVDEVAELGELPPPPKERARPVFQLPKLPQFHLPSLPRFPSRFPLLPLILVVLVLAGLVGAYYFVPQATVTLTLQAKPITETLTLTLKSEATTVDPQSAIIPAQLTRHEISGQDTIAVTGTKTIGDPARGEVTIYNRTTLPKTLLKGTTLTSGNLKFTLDSDVTVASKSAGADYVDVPGRANVKITAATFGTAGNLSSGTEFTVASFTKDSYVAKNDAALSGGTSQEVTVVTQSDQTKLLDSLTAKLESELAASFLSAQNGSTNYFVISEDLEVIKADYSRKLGDPATELSAEVTLSFGVLTYDQTDVATLVASTIDQSVPAGYRKTDLPPSVSLRDTTVLDNQDIQADAEITLYVSPILDEAAITQSLRGRRYTQATNLLASIPGVVDSHITLKPNLPPRLLALPRSASRITLLVETSK